MLEYVANSYFDVSLGDDVSGLSGEFISVSGLGIEFEFEKYCEGGGSTRRFFVGTVGQTLVLEQGMVTSNDAFTEWVKKIDEGRPAPVSGTIKLKNHAGVVQREWKIEKATIIKYIGPVLNSNQPELAVSHIELAYGGCS